MNFEEITNVSDLMKANEAPNPKEKIHDDINELVKEAGPAVALEIASELIGKLVNLHEAISENRQEEGDIDGAITWSNDGRSLAMAKFILENIEL